MCLPSDALQHLPSYLGFSYLGCGVSLNGCSSKVQLLLLTLDEGYLLTAAPPDLEHGPSGRSAPAAIDDAEAWLRGATPHPRSGAAAEKSYPTPKVRGSSGEEQPRIQGAVAAQVQEA